MLQRLQELEATVVSLKASMAEQASIASQSVAALEKRIEELERHGRTGPLKTGVVKAKTNLKEPEPPDIEECQIKTCKGEEPKPQLECSMGETVWDSAAIIGLPEVGWCESALLFLNVLLNVAVQGYLCSILLANPSFRRKHHFRNMLPDLLRWRLSVGHSYSQLDATNSTLVSRVCNADDALSVAGSQLSLLDEINAYLSLDAEALEGDGFSTGQFICMVCLFLFLVIMLRELRSAVISAVAFAQLPRGSSTRIDSGKFITLSPWRLLMILLIGAARISIAVALLVAGVMWLSSTSSTSDLILNAAALGFIMDLDEILFETTVPMHVQNLVRDLAPLEVRRPPLHAEAVLPLLAAIAAVITSMYAFVWPNMADMLDVKRVLCGGFQDFVVTTNPVGFVVSRPTTPFSEASQARTMEQLAVRELRDNPLDDSRFNFSIVHRDSQYFTLEKDMTLKSLAEGSLCADLDTHRNGEVLRLAPSWFMTARHVSGLHSGLLLDEQPWSCAEYAGFCDKIGFMRTLCPITCGCTDPTSGLFLRGVVHGCPGACEPELDQRMSNLSCVDLDVTGSPSWTRYWEEHAHFMDSITGVTSQEFQDFRTRKIQGGCANRDIDFTGTDFCNKEHVFHKEQGAGTILGFCPETCCGGPEPPADCPTDCPGSG